MTFYRDSEVVLEEGTKWDGKGVLDTAYTFTLMWCFTMNVSSGASMLQPPRYFVEEFAPP
jgi:hypothetical protein